MALFAMDPGCDQSYYHGKTGTFYFVRCAVEGDTTALECYDRHGERITFYRCLDPEARLEWIRYREQNPRVQKIEADEIAARKANPSRYLPELSTDLP